MHRIASTLTLGLLVALTGCPGDDTSTTTAAGSSTDAATSTGSVDPTEADTTAGTPDTTTGTPDTTTGTPDTTTGTPDTTTGMPGTSGDSSGGGGGACDPDPADDACATCVKGNCCSQLEACFADGDETMGCFCYQGCIDAGGGPIGDCDEQCGVNPFDMGTPTGALGGCTLGNCAADCPLG